MTAAQLSVVALALVIAASFFSRINVGILAVALAGPVALHAAGWSPDEVLKLFPAPLFLTLLGVTLLFGVAQANGAMAALTHGMLRLAGGRARWVPALFFLLACAVSTVGPGAIATLALLAPLGMAAGARAGLPPLLTALMLGNGANAGNLSPFSAVGVIVADGMGAAGLTGHQWTVWAANFTAHLLVSLVAWALFGGPRLWRETARVVLDDAVPFDGRHRITLAVIALFVLAVTMLKAHIGLTAFAGVAFLLLIGAGEDAATLKQVPWAVLVMVCGVSVLIGVLEKTGGMSLFSDLLARIATPASVNGVIAFVTGTISTYSSTSGVVYPTFLPTVTDVVARLGGGSALEVALSINVGAALVDVSPLSTLGALCIAALPKGEDEKRLFRQLLLWGTSMTVVGALFCQFCIGWFIR
ncbi:MAG: hypothetical protein RI891_92 [Gemmatimonadota bacterium]